VILSSNGLILVNIPESESGAASGVIAPLVLDRSDVTALLPPMPELVDLVTETYRQAAAGAVDVPSKIGVHTDRPHSFFHAMPAWLGARREAGMKWVSYFPGSQAVPDSDATAIMILNEPEAGRPVAIMEAMQLTNARTAACGIFAAMHLAPAEAKHLGLIGCGALPSWTVPELARRFPSMRSASVFSRREPSRAAFAKRISAETGLSVTPVDTARAAVEGADIVLSAIPQGPPPIARGAWLEPGALVVAFDILGTWGDDALGRFGLLATDSLPRLQSIIASQRAPARLPDRIVSFDEIAATGKLPGGAVEGPVLAVPSGVASLDVAVAWAVYRRAKEIGRGRPVRLF